MHATFLQNRQFSAQIRHIECSRSIWQALSVKCKSIVQQISPHSCLNGFYQKVRNKCDWECVGNGGLIGYL